MFAKKQRFSDNISALWGFQFVMALPKIHKEINAALNPMIKPAVTMFLPLGGSGNKLWTQY